MVPLSQLTTNLLLTLTQGNSHKQTNSQSVKSGENPYKMNTEVMYLRDMGGTMCRSQFSFAEEVAAVAMVWARKRTNPILRHMEGDIVETLPPLELRNEWRNQQVLARQTTHNSLQPGIATRSWKINHHGSLTGGMWQGEEEEFISHPYIWICGRWGNREAGTQRINPIQYDHMSKMDKGDRTYFLPKTTIGARGQQIKPKLKDEMRVGTIIECKEMLCQWHPSESGWFRLAIEWSPTKISVPVGHPMRKHGRGATIMDISDIV